MSIAIVSGAVAILVWGAVAYVRRKRDERLVTLRLRGLK